MKPFVHEALPGRVVFGVGSVGQVADEVAALGAERVLLVVDEASKAVGDRIADDLGERYAGRLDEVRQHVPEDLATAARRTAVEARADGVVTSGADRPRGWARRSPSTRRRRRPRPVVGSRSSPSPRPTRARR